MTAFKSDLMRVLSDRGFIHQCSNPVGLDALAATRTVTGYIGFDCTAKSLHVGSLVQIMMLRWMQKTGHRPIALMGSGTTRVGDPSGKDESRALLSPDEIAANKAALRTVFDKFLTFGDGPSDALMVDNAEWLLSLKYVDFLREVGSHLSVNQMIQRDSVKLRLERQHHLSFLEFNYMVLQAYDFVELARRYDCRLQLGGSDQWGNIVSGIELGRRLENIELFALTSPLIATASGAKMGKTARGVVWLDADLVSPYEYWQFWRNTEDADVGRFLKLFTELPLDEIGRLAALAGAELNEAKKVLANEATAILHGRTAAAEAAEAARRTFDEGDRAEALPTKEIDKGKDDEWPQGQTTVAIVEASGLVRSRSEARQKIKERAVRINDQIVENPTDIVPWDNVDPEFHAFKVQLGKKKIVLVKPKA